MDRGDVDDTMFLDVVEYHRGSIDVGQANECIQEFVACRGEFTDGLRIHRVGVVSPVVVNGVDEDLVVGPPRPVDDQVVGDPHEPVEQG